jgi:DNA-binding NtrC family response regulator
MSTESNASIVIVDDEDMVLTSLNAYLTLETDYEVHTFNSANAALSHLEQSAVDLVISDYLMPEMDGITFLAKVRDLHPEAPRIILTGYADKENAIKGINEVGLYQYIEKPWDNDELRLIIRNALEKRELVAKLRTKIDEINRAYGELQGIQHEILKTFV